jgi:hypothetical protein
MDENESLPTKEELVAEIQRRIAYLLETEDFSREEKEAIARKFFQTLERP